MVAIGTTLPRTRLLSYQNPICPLGLFSNAFCIASYRCACAAASSAGNAPGFSLTVEVHDRAVAADASAATRARFLPCRIPTTSLRKVRLARAANLVDRGLVRCRSNAGVKRIPQGSRDG